MNNLLLNCDIGESFGAWRMGLDAEVMPLIDCANIACGFHAGDPGTMRRTVALAVEHGVRIGAHPGYPDLVGFGRRSLACSAQEVEDLLLYQIGALDGLCRAQGTRVRYVKPHGALYQDMMRDPAILAAVRALAAYDRTLPLMLMSTRDNTAARALGEAHGIELWFEAFADRAYDGAGYLVSRSQPGAVHHDAETVLAQALLLARARAASQRRQRPGAGGADPLRTRRQSRLAGCGAAHPRRPGGGMSQPQPRIEVAAIDSFVLRLFERIDEANMPWLLAAEKTCGRRSAPPCSTWCRPTPPCSCNTTCSSSTLARPARGSPRRCPTCARNARTAAVCTSCRPGTTRGSAPTWNPWRAQAARRRRADPPPQPARVSGLRPRFQPRLRLHGAGRGSPGGTRLATPRQRIAAGSVGIAERQTAVYPQASPGGWNLLGRCPVRLFDLTLDGYSLLRAGDRVRFEPIGHAEFVRLGGDDTPLEVQA